MERLAVMRELVLRRRGIDAHAADGIPSLGRGAAVVMTVMMRVAGMIAVPAAA